MSMSNISIGLKKQERKKLKQQERLLIDLAKEFRKLLLNSGKTETELKQYLDKNDAFVTGVKHGFGNIRIRELADIFTFFNKSILLKPVEIGEKYQIIQVKGNIQSYSKKRPACIRSDIKSLLLISINDKLEHGEQAIIRFNDPDEDENILEVSDMLENTLTTTYQTAFKSKTELKNGR